MELAGLPPAKRPGASLRNPKHPRYQAFVDLRNAATLEMNGRAWYFGAVQLDVKVRAPERLGHWALLEYAGVIMDTLDGSSGVHFTYLPIVYEDDCQVSCGATKYEKSPDESYAVHVRFL